MLLWFHKKMKALVNSIEAINFNSIRSRFVKLSKKLISVKLNSNVICENHALISQ